MNSLTLSPVRTQVLTVAEFEDMAKKKLLVIDDDESICEVVKGSLEDLAGWQVMTISSPQQGLVKAITEKLDALILDVMMPQMDGLTLLQRLRENPLNPSIPVILLTANSHLPNLVTLAELGVMGVIAKPFNALLLHRQIMAFLGWQ